MDVRGISSPQTYSSGCFFVAEIKSFLFFCEKLGISRAWEFVRDHYCGSKFLSLSRSPGTPLQGSCNTPVYVPNSHQFGEPVSSQWLVRTYQLLVASVHCLIISNGRSPHTLLFGIIHRFIASCHIIVGLSQVNIERLLHQRWKRQFCHFPLSRPRSQNEFPRELLDAIEMMNLTDELPEERYRYSPYMF